MIGTMFQRMTENCAGEMPAAASHRSFGAAAFASNVRLFKRGRGSRAHATENFVTHDNGLA